MSRMEVTAVDGRRARRERGRRAVIDAMVDLIREEHGVPTTEAVAERAGVSMASIFRYFANLDELREHTIARFRERYAALFEVPDIGTGTFEERVASFVTARATLYEEIAPVSRLARSRMTDHPQLAVHLQVVRSHLTDQVRTHFQEELNRRTPAVRDDLVAVVTALTSFDSWDQLTGELVRTPQQVRRAWSTALRSLLD